VEEGVQAHAAVEMPAAAIEAFPARDFPGKARDPCDVMGAEDPTRLKKKSRPDRDRSQRVMACLGKRNGEDVLKSMHMDHVDGLLAPRLSASSVSSDVALCPPAHRAPDAPQTSGTTHALDGDTAACAASPDHAQTRAWRPRQACRRVEGADVRAPLHHPASKEEWVEDSPDRTMDTDGEESESGPPRRCGSVAADELASPLRVDVTEPTGGAVLPGTRMQRAWQAACEDPTHMQSLFFRGTHIPAHGWLNACRICGSWTSRTRPIQGAHLSVPLCSGCAERIDKGTLFALYPLDPCCPPPVAPSPNAHPSGPVPLGAAWSTPEGRPWVSRQSAASGGPFQTVQFLKDHMRRNGGDFTTALHQLHLRVSTLLSPQ